jgi:hypothetical protein
MSKLNSASNKTIFLIGSFAYFTAAITTLLLPLAPLFMSEKGYAAPLEGARVVKAGGIVLFKKSGSSRSKKVDENGYTEEGVAELRKLEDVLTVTGDSQSYASFESSPSGMQVHTRPLPQKTEYTFPCRANVGNIVLGWGKGKDRSCAPPGVTFITGRSLNAQLLEPFKIAQVINQHLIAQTSLEQLKFLYCSVAAKGRGWWTRWGSWEDGYDPCEEATQQCLQASSEGKCTVVSMGEWKATDRNLLVSIECADNRVLTAKSGGVTAAQSLVRELLLEAKFDRNKLCGLNVYHPNDVIVAPASEQATLIQAQGLDNTLTIDALVGDVIIRSAKTPGGKILKVRHRYTYPDDNVQPINNRDLNDMPLVKEFLDPINWPQGTAKQIESYRSSPLTADTADTSNIPIGSILNTLWTLWNLFGSQRSPEPGLPPNPYPTKSYPSSSPIIR